MLSKSFPGLEQFRLSEEKQNVLSRKFVLVLEDANFTTRSQEEIMQSLGRNHNCLGVYFFVLTIGLFSYALYIGKTNSITRRVKEYLNEFQAHSPNDYKIQIFQKMVLKKVPKAQFSLYFRDADLNTYTALEKELIEQFNPIMNKRAIAGQGARVAFREAFEKYYRAGFEELLN